MMRQAGDWTVDRKDSDLDVAAKLAPCVRPLQVFVSATAAIPGGELPRQESASLRLRGDRDRPQTLNLSSHQIFGLAKLRLNRGPFLVPVSPWTARGSPQRRLLCTSSCGIERSWLLVLP